MLADKQLPANIENGGIIGFDIDNLELPEFHAESHQIHLERPLSDAEYAALDALLDYDIDGNDIDSWEGQRWINCGPLSDAARAFLLALKA